MSVVRRVLQDLAEHLAPIDAVMDPDTDVLIVASESSSILVEPVATVTTSAARSYYRDAETGRLFGSTSEPKKVAAAIASELFDRNHP